jgi:transposase
MKRAPRHEITGPGGTLPLRPGDEAAADLVMLIEGETSGRALDEVLADFGRSRSTYYEKLRRFRDQGLEGLLARPPGPRTSWRRPLEVVRYVVTTRLRHPDRSPAAIAAELASLGHPVSVRSVERTLTQFGLTRPRQAPVLTPAQPPDAAPAAPADTAPAVAVAVAAAADPADPHGSPHRKEAAK